MKKALAYKIAKHWNDNFAGGTDATKTKAVVKHENVYLMPTSENDGRCFYHMEEFADVMRAFKVNGLVCMRSDDNGNNIVVARFF